MHIPVKKDDETWYCVSAALNHLCNFRSVCEFNLECIPSNHNAEIIVCREAMAMTA